MSCLAAGGTVLEQGWEASRHLAGQLVVFGAVAGLAGLLAVGTMHEVGQMVSLEFRRKCCEELLGKEVSCYGTESAEAVVTRLEAEGHFIENSAGKVIISFVESVVCSASACLLACVYSPELTLLGLIIIFPSIFAYSLLYFAYKRLKNKKKAFSERANQLSQQTAKNLTTISALNGQRHLQTQYNGYLTTTTGLSSTSAALQGLQSGIVWGACLVLVAALLWAGKARERLFWKGRIRQEDAVMVAGALVLLVYCLRIVVISGTTLFRALEIANSVSKSPPNTATSSIGGEKRAIAGAVEFQNVHFAYPSEAEVLCGVCWSCAPGEALALLGPARSGKSTVLGLLQLLLSPSLGQVLIDSFPIHTLESAILRRSIGYVPQRPILFHLTLQENIALGTKNFSDFDLREAARRAHLLEYAVKLREQFATDLKRTKLTEEQRVKVGIARALLRKPAILILDEALSMLESSSQEAMLTALKGKVTVISASRKLTCAHLFEKIYSLAEGKATEKLAADWEKATSKSLPLLLPSREVIRENCEFPALKKAYFPTIWCMGLWQTLGAVLAVGAGACFPLAGLGIGHMAQGQELSGWALALSALGFALLVCVMWLYARLAGELTHRIANYGFKALAHVELAYRDEHYSAVAAMARSLVSDAEKVSAVRTIRYGVVLFTLSALLVSVGIDVYYGYFWGLAVLVPVQSVGFYYGSLERRSLGQTRPCSHFLKQALSSMTSVTASSLQPFVLSQYTSELSATMTSRWGPGLLFTSGFTVVCWTFALALLKAGNADWLCCLSSGFVTSLGISAAAFLYPSKNSGLQAERRLSAVTTRYRARFALQSDGIVLPPKGHIVFKHVNFSYLSRMILHSISFQLNSQEIVGICGPSGAGKTTLSLLLARLYDPTTGIITADGVDLRLYSPSKVHDFVGLASHDSVLFAGTIEYNIRFGSTKSSESLQEVLRLLQVQELQLEREIGRQISHISAVNRRKIGLARVLLRCPRVIVLDDITRDLDEFSEKELLATLQAAIRQKSVVMMSQRLSPLDICHRILTIQQGVISES